MAWAYQKYLNGRIWNAEWTLNVFPVFENDSTFNSRIHEANIQKKWVCSKPWQCPPPWRPAPRRPGVLHQGVHHHADLHPVFFLCFSDWRTLSSCVFLVGRNPWVYSNDIPSLPTHWLVGPLIMDPHRQLPHHPSFASRCLYAGWGQIELLHQCFSYFQELDAAAMEVCFVGFAPPFIAINVWNRKAYLESALFVASKWFMRVFVGLSPGNYLCFILSKLFCPLVMECLTHSQGWISDVRMACTALSMDVVGCISPPISNSF